MEIEVKKNNMRSKVTRIVLILILGFTIPFLTAFTTPTPKTLYRVYLKGKSIGLIKSKTSLEKYIDQQQNQIKKEFGVDKVYLPEDLDIVKEVTFDNDISTTKEIYKKIENISPCLRKQTIVIFRTIREKQMLCMTPA